MENTLLGMNRVDGLLLIFVGISLIMVRSPANTFYFTTRAVTIILNSVSTLVYRLFMCIKRNARAIKVKSLKNHHLDSLLTCR